MRVTDLPCIEKNCDGLDFGVWRLLNDREDLTANEFRYRKYCAAQYCKYCLIRVYGSKRKVNGQPIHIIITNKGALQSP